MSPNIRQDQRCDAHQELSERLVRVETVCESTHSTVLDIRGEMREIRGALAKADAGTQRASGASSTIWRMIAVGVAAGTMGAGMVAAVAAVIRLVTG